LQKCFDINQLKYSISGLGDHSLSLFHVAIAYAVQKNLVSLAYALGFDTLFDLYKIVVCNVLWLAT